MKLKKRFEGWTLFLDRDGVINEKLEGDYVKNWDDFTFKSRSLEAIAGLSNIFARIFIVTNQRGVGIGIMTEAKLIEIHDKMLAVIEKASGRVDKIFYCTCINNNAECRKPNIGMALKAKNDFPEIDFSRSIMVGDSISDMEFGKNIGMKRIYISDGVKALTKYQKTLINFEFSSLYEFYVVCKNLIFD